LCLTSLHSNLNLYLRATIKVNLRELTQDQGFLAAIVRPLNQEVHYRSIIG
jgi:hypothetical protein